MAGRVVAKGRLVLSGAVGRAGREREHNADSYHTFGVLPKGMAAG